MIEKPASLDQPSSAFVVFQMDRRIAAGSLSEAALAAARAMSAGDGATVFNASTGEVVDLDLRGAENDVIARYAPAPAVKRGRPKLGVVPREVTLLPRHWAWLSAQPGGASVALRKLVDAARKQDDGAGAARVRTEAAYRFMAAMAGDQPGFEEAARALFAGADEALTAHMRHWPADISDQVLAYLHSHDRRPSRS